MRSHTERRQRAATVAAVVMAAWSIAAVPVQDALRSKADTPGPAEIKRALATVAGDPNLSAERTIKTLRWKDSGETKPSRTPGWLAWLIGLFRWIDESARILVWVAAIVLAGVLALYVVRLLRTRSSAPGRREDAFVAPTHVRDLDIRPETLPLNIGAAARALWDCGEHRASLALLYRGMLSRLAHVQGVPIRDSSTEGDCLALAANRLSRARCEYLARLVGVWQRFGYGHEHVQAAIVYGLCDDFSSALDLSSALESTPTRGAA